MQVETLRTKTPLKDSRPTGVKGNRGHLIQGSLLGCPKTKRRALLALSSARPPQLNFHQSTTKTPRKLIMETQKRFDSPSDLRLACREGRFQQQTAGMCPGFAQAGLTALPKALAFDFLLFCTRNPEACSLIEVTDPGSPTPPTLAKSADLRKDIAMYRVTANGQDQNSSSSEVLTVSDAEKYWRPDLVSFLLGCSFSFEDALAAAGIPVRHIEEGVTVPMYITNRQCKPSGPFKAPLVVSMRPMTPSQALLAVKVTSRHRLSHGAPIHLGSPADIGIKNIDEPDFGNKVTMKEGEIPVFWACGLSAQLALKNANPELAITHAPGYMFISDVTTEELCLR
ncbi:hypothetical protein BSKO_04509 [Bryopsis sp. KO-2023]|nr:hypothetical protein BSKO_04509 [Bryopsis sp. KO-2023]